MKIRRYKKVNKRLGFYINNFGFRQPYQLLVDGTFCYAALNNKINIANNIPRYLQGDIKLLTTQCAIIEMENLGPKLNGALLILKKYVIHKCGHEGKPILGSQCFLSMLGSKNENHYIIATQDRDLQDIVRNKPGVPLLYLHSKTPILEQPSELSMKAVKDKLANLCETEKIALEELKLKGGIVSNEEKPKKRKKKGPNPLSCKKKRYKPNLQTVTISKKESRPEVEKRKRKRIKIPKHVKEELLKIKTNE
ncbi:rRNA-processing protein UTP23 homolog [Anoplophora glabripennis]|uniref:rRNA-processing protein UTP23 homolog n=1 Tax=Anoplophora glabripennis TaxID=217634 RepID=UPI000875567D|nr:rRNA-processing protein UTP23 homolog [Anoplophora glabripennis]